MCETGMDKKPLVTVISLAYNHAPYIRQTLESIVRQETSFPIEVVINDDASQDGTADIIREYESAYPAIMHPIYQKDNQTVLGRNLIREILIPNIRSKYVAICEGDDFWTDMQKLHKQVTYMENHPDCSMTASSAELLYEEETICTIKRHTDECDIGADEIISGGGNWLATASLCCRTDIFLDYPRFRAYAAVADYPLMILSALKGVVHYFPEVMAAYRFMRPESWSATTSSGQDIQRMREWMEDEIALYTRLLEYSPKHRKIILRRREMYENNLWNFGVYDFSAYMEAIKKLEDPNI